MKTYPLHPWSLSVAKAKAIQKNLSAWIVLEGEVRNPSIIARVHIIPQQRSEPDSSEMAKVTITRWPANSIVEKKIGLRQSQFPRVDSLLSFRKAPAVLAALAKLSHTPDLIICDGRGITGPDSFGLASHIGLLTNLPTIGIRPPKPRDQADSLQQTRGNWIRLNQHSGYAALVRVIDNMDPLLVSAGHKISLESAIEWVFNYFPANMPSRDYLQLLYPDRDNAQTTHKPNLRLVGD